jgi:hypothetical protein
MTARIASKECSDMTSRDGVLGARLPRKLGLDELLALRQAPEFRAPF